MDSIRIILPYLLALFFIIKGNKQPIYFLGIPFLMFMSNSIFFEDAKIFSKPGSLFDHLTFLWLILLWIFTKLVSKKRVAKKSRKINLNVLDILVFTLILLSIFGFITAYFESQPNTTGILNEFFIEISMFLAYFMIKNWISINKSEVIIDFLYSLVVVNSLACFLFILHQGLHFNIYTNVEYLTETFNGQEITRSFWFMPQFLSFSVVFLLVFNKKNYFISQALLAINLMAIVITYNVSTIIIAILMVTLYYILMGIKNNRLGSAFKQLTLFASVGIVSIFILTKILPANTNYLKARFSNLSESQYTEKEPNSLKIRFINTESVLIKIDNYKKIFGMGPITDLQSQNVIEMRGATADMVWVGVIYQWGIVGLVLFISMYLFSLLKTFNIFKKSENNISDLCLLFFLYLISQILEGFVSWTFLSGHGITTGLWYFATISVLIGFNKYKNLPDNLNGNLSQ